MIDLLKHLSDEELALLIPKDIDKQFDRLPFKNEPTKFNYWAPKWASPRTETAPYFFSYRTKK